MTRRASSTPDGRRKRRGLAEAPAPYRGTSQPVVVGVTEFKAKCLGLIDDVAQGRVDKVVLTRRGAPVAEIVATRARSGSLYGCMRGTVIFHPGVDLTKPTGETWDIE